MTRILFISAAKGPDYLSDMALHGLRTRPDLEVIDYPKVDCMYDTYRDTTHLYGRGFTLYGLLPDIDIDRADIERKVASRYFNLIVYGSIHRSKLLLGEVGVAYRPSEILFLDGEDHSHLVYLNGRGLYFKRELASAIPGILPVSFAIPAEKIRRGPQLKSQILADLDPRDRSTYIYDSESAYYDAYSRSLFGLTLRKSGWDCLRHYEILAAGTIPLFLSLDQCPATTLTTLPKSDLIDASRAFHDPNVRWDSDAGHAIWTALYRRIRRHFLTHCTTAALAAYLLDTQRRLDS